MYNTYMLDTNIFNAILDGRARSTSLMGHRLLVTGVQADELRATKKPERRTALLNVYMEIHPVSLPSSSFAFDIEGAGSGQANWNDGSGNFEKMLARLQQLDAKNKNASNQVRDILIAETAIKHRAILVSGDSNLRQVVSEFEGSTLAPVSFCSSMPSG
jgi:predicted nucleic acid-binding protein